MRRSFLFAVAIAALIAVCVPVPAFSQAVQVRQAGGGGWGGGQALYPTGQSLMYLIYYPQIQKEIEIIDSQKEELQKIQKEMSEKMTEAYKALSDQAQGDQQERYKKYNELYQTLGKETDERVSKVLLPHQRKRMTQILLQMKLQQSGYGYGGAAALGGDEVVKELGITDEQKDSLRKKEEEIRASLQKKYAEFYKKLQEESREELFSVLTPTQRKKLEELLGDKFEWQQWQSAQPAGAATKKDEKKGD